MSVVMIDIETMGTDKDCVVLTIGAVKFDPYNYDVAPHDPFYLVVNVDEQLALGRTVSDSTMEWWGNQPQSAQDAAFTEEGRMSLDEVTTQLNRYMVGMTKIWAQGPLFDMIILENLYITAGKSAPWQYWQVRDSRTIGDMGNYSAKTANKDAHNALADAYSQALGVQQIYHDLGVTK